MFEIRKVIKLFKIQKNIFFMSSYKFVIVFTKFSQNILKISFLLSISFLKILIRSFILNL
ncbi:hypothetical protein CCAN12_400010 [Capnocytophaga canimorsus]|uniref:Uncharacterized protein n=1 Tax=Capnocytophaga canimorsus TaxID=28188 RepID=A0A0B7H6U2_9FLAO|nr:hypothetical protein CCAN12_400010 [Capnocytophaga canimorsus]